MSTNANSRPKHDCLALDTHLSVSKALNTKEFKLGVTQKRNAGNNSLMTLDNVLTPSVPFDQRFLAQRFNRISHCYVTIRKVAGKENAETLRI